MDKPLNETLLTEAEISKILGVKPRTLQDWRLLGRGPKFLKISSRVIRYRWSDVQEWIADIQAKNKKSLS